MQLGLTIPLQRALNLKNLTSGGPLDRRFCWDIHSITLHGRQCLLAVHCASRYAFVRFDLCAAELGELALRFLEGLEESLRQGGCSAKQVERYLHEAGPVTLTKTHGRREVAFLNRAWDDVVALDYTIEPSTQCQPLLDCAVNALPRRCAGHQGLGRADERLWQDLSQEAGFP